MEIMPEPNSLPEHPHLTLISEYSELTEKQQRLVTYLLEHAEVRANGKVNISPVREQLRNDGYESNDTSYLYQILGQHFAFDRGEERASDTSDEDLRQAFQEGFVAGWRAALTHGDAEASSSNPYSTES